MPTITIPSTEKERAVKEAKARAAVDRARLPQVANEAAAANSVPVLRAKVAELCEIMARLEARQSAMETTP